MQWTGGVSARRVMTLADKRILLMADSKSVVPQAAHQQWVL